MLLDVILTKKVTLNVSAENLDAREVVESIEHSLNPEELCVAVEELKVGELTAIVEDDAVVEWTINV